MIKVGIIGATGYTALELLRILLRHPHADITRLTSRKKATSLAEVHPQLLQKIDVPLVPFSIDDFSEAVDFAFCCLPHGASAEIVKELVDRNLKVVDFSADYRLDNWESFEQWYNVSHPDRDRVGSVPYGVPELFRKSISGAQLVANPGCFPSSALLPLAPVIAKDLIAPTGIIIDSKTGISGGGRNPKPHLHYPEANESISAYAVGTHRHQPEIDQLATRFSQKTTSVVFTPHLAPMNRGILSTCYVDPASGKTAGDIFDHLKNFYDAEPFVRVSQALPATRNVSHSNYCDIAVRENGSKVIVLSALDNLVKGASGAAVQNFNLMNGFEETMGLLTEFA